MSGGRSGPTERDGGHREGPQLSSDERRGLLKRLLGRPSNPPPAAGGPGKLFTAHSRPEELRPRPETAERPDDDGSHDDDAPATPRSGTAPAEADRWDEVLPSLGGFDEELFSPENLAALEERARAEQAMAAEQAVEATRAEAEPRPPGTAAPTGVTEPVAPAPPPGHAADDRDLGRQHEGELRPPATYDALTAPPTPPDAIDAPPPPPAAQVVVSDIPPADHPLDPDLAAIVDADGPGGVADDDPASPAPAPREAASELSALTDELTRLAEGSSPETPVEADDLDLDDLADLDGLGAALAGLDDHDVPTTRAITGEAATASRPEVPADDDEPAPWVGHTDQLDEPYAAPSAVAPHRPATPAGERYPDHEAHDGSAIEVTGEDGDRLFVRRTPAPPEPAEPAEPAETVDAATVDTTPGLEAPAPAAATPEPDEPAAAAPPEPEPELEAPAPAESTVPGPRHEAGDAPTPADESAARTAPAVEPAQRLEPRPAVQPTSPTPAHAAAHDLPEDTPETRVHADRIDERPGPIRLTPSEAVTLAAEGPGALRRRRRDG